MICDKCNTEIPDNSNFCLNCGNYIEKAEIPKTNVVEENDSNSYFSRNVMIIIVAILIIAYLFGYEKQEEPHKSISSALETPSIKQLDESNKTSDTDTEKYDLKEFTESVDKKRNEFVNTIGEALNAPELPIMCEKVYFNSDNDLILEVNGEWLILDEALKKDMIYALKEVLRQNKISLNSSGYGQFFSASGQPLESFYVK